jgi:cytosine/adenosine deaminase-related metal-dependent hydrolase
MAYEKLQGDQLFDGRQFHGPEKTLVLDGEGQMADIINSDEAGDGIRYVPGLIRPGFVNAHCHLELSHMKDVIPPHTGLVPFLLDVVGKRDFPIETIHQAIDSALAEMRADGITAVGDISNTDVTAAFKASGGMHFHTFVEVLSFLEEKTPDRIRHYNEVLASFLGQGAGPANLTPHAPYSVSQLAFRMINDATENAIVSIHNQETPAEDELYRSGSGAFLQLFQKFGIEGSPFPVTGFGSIRAYLPHFTKGQTLLLIHNTFMPLEDLQWAREVARKNGTRLVFCFCVNANLYIENRMPDVLQFRDEGCHIVLGTDSYSSNWQLKISAEISAIRDRYPEIPVSEVYRWATFNGTDALGINPAWLWGLPLVEGV